MGYKINYQTIVEFFIATAVLGVAVSYSKLYLFHIALVITLVSFFYVRIKNYKFHRETFNTRLHWIFYIMFIWYFLSIVWSINKINSLMYIFYIFCGISIVFIIIYHSTNLDRLNRIFKVLSIFFIIEILISLLEVLSVLRLPVSPYSKYVEYFGRNTAMTTDLPLRLHNLYSYTPTGFNWNQNNLAFVMNIILPFFLFAKYLKLKLFGAISIFCIIYFTESRGNVVAYFFIIALYLFIMSRNKWLFRILAILTIIFSFFIGLNFSKLKSSQIVDSLRSIETFFTTKVSEHNSIGERQRYILNGLQALKNTYGLGVGAGNSGNKEYHLNIYGRSHQVSMHNFWIEVLVDGGVLFALIFYSWYIILIVSIVRVINSSKSNLTINYYSKALALSLGGFFIGAVSASSVIYEFPMWILFGFSIAVVNISRKNTSADQLKA
jgi:teichuronic acid biosynthesis protein TuaE